MATTLQIEKVPAQRRVAGIESFAVHAPAAVAARRFAAMPMRLRAALPERLPWPTRRVGLAIAAVAALLIAGVEVMALGASARSVDPAATRIVSAPASAEASPIVPAKPVVSAWIEINRPFPLFDLTGSDFAKQHLDYRARRRQDATERQDLLTFGEFSGDAPFLFLSILRAAPDADRPRFFVDVARLAGDDDLGILRSGMPTAMETRFGDFETADLTLKGRSGSRSCLAFRPLASDGKSGPVAIAGVACGSAAKPVDRKSLACAVDRVDLLAAGDDSVLQRFFAEAELRHAQGCSDSQMQPIGTQATWLDGEALAPPLHRADHEKSQREAKTAFAHEISRRTLTRRSEL